MSSASSQQSSLSGEHRADTKKYLLLYGTTQKLRSSPKHSGISKVKKKLTGKTKDQQALAGSLWESRCEPASSNSSVSSVNSANSRQKSRTLAIKDSPTKKLELDSIEYDDVMMSCPEHFVIELSESQCRLLLAIPNCKERYTLVNDNKKLNTITFVSVGSWVTVRTRHQGILRCVVRWMGRLPGKQGTWFGLEIQVCILFLL